MARCWTRSQKNQKRPEEFNGPARLLCRTWFQNAEINSTPATSWIEPCRDFRQINDKRSAAKTDSRKHWCFHENGVSGPDMVAFSRSRFPRRVRRAGGPGRWFTAATSPVRPNGGVRTARNTTLFLSARVRMDISRTSRRLQPQEARIHKMIFVK